MDRNNNGFGGVAADGDNAHRVEQRRHEDSRLVRLLGLPLVVLLLLEAAVWAAIVAAAALEQPLVESALALILPGAAPSVLRVASVAYLLVYVLSWHAVGHRLGEARRLRLATSQVGSGWRSLNPAFGGSGVVFALVGVGSLALVAGCRTYALADLAGTKAAGRLVTTSGGSASPAALAAAYEDAYWTSFWPDLGITFAVMALVAALALWVGMQSLARHEAISVRVAEIVTGWHERRARRAEEQAELAERHVDIQRRARDDRAAEHAEFRAALTNRFARAREVFRHTLAAGLGQSEATTVLTDAERARGPR